VSKNSCWVNRSRRSCLLICRGSVCWLQYFRVEVLFKGLLLHFWLFDEGFEVVFRFWVYGRGSGSKLWEGRLLRSIMFDRDSWVLFWDNSGLFWHILGWRSKIAWTSLLLVSLWMGFMNTGSRKHSIKVSWESVVYSVSVMRLLSLVVHIWPDDVDVIDILFMIMMLSWL